MSSDTEPQLVLVLLLTDIAVMSTICVAAGKPIGPRTVRAKTSTDYKQREKSSARRRGVQRYRQRWADVIGGVQSTLCHVLYAAHRCRWLTDLRRRRVAAQSFLSASSQQDKDTWLGTCC